MKGVVWLVFAVAMFAIPAAAGEYRNNRVPFAAVQDFKAADLDGLWIETGQVVGKNGQQQLIRHRMFKFDPQTGRIKRFILLSIDSDTGKFKFQRTGEYVISAPGRMRIPNQKYGSEIWVLWLDKQNGIVVMGKKSGAHTVVLTRKASLTTGQLAKVQEVLSRNGYYLNQLRAITR